MIIIFLEMTVKINKQMDKYMDSIMNMKHETDNTISQFFDSKRLYIINKNVRNGNFYTIDRFGLVIRKDEYGNTRSPYGWRYYTPRNISSEDYEGIDNKEPINIHINDILLQTNSPDIQKVTIQYLQRENPSLFKGPRGILYKVYTSLNINEYTLSDESQSDTENNTAKKNKRTTTPAKGKSKTLDLSSSKKKQTKDDSDYSFEEPPKKRK